jgi:GNAT superfamily N-acetyltransferase
MTDGGEGQRRKVTLPTELDAMTIRPCGADDVPAMFSIINDAAIAYQGVIPADRWHEPYMPLDELEEEIGRGVVFWGCESGGELVGVMGVQDRGDVTLIRHAYVRTGLRRKGIGETLLKHLEATTTKPILIGTWKAASWAIRFYEKNGYRLLSKHEIDHLLSTYWSIPERQMETSVVLADARWKR